MAISRLLLTEEFWAFCLLCINFPLLIEICNQGKGSWHQVFGSTVPDGQSCLRSQTDSVPKAK